MPKLTCLCENKFDAQFPSVVNVDEKPDVIEIILRGDFLTAQCPACGKILRLEFPFQLINKKDNWEIQFVPEVDRTERLKKLKKEKKYSPSQRIVIGYPELVEKLAIFKNGLDDRVIEYIKYHLLSHILAKIGENEDKEIGIYFTEKKNDSLAFHIKGLKNDEIGISNIPIVSYEKTLKEIDSKINDEPFCDFLLGPYISINKIYTWI
jgi:hypothetical protein